MATLDRQVGASSDDCFVDWDGAVWTLSLTRIMACVGYNTSSSYKRGGGYRFTNISIPKGSTITAAYITITCDQSATVDTVNSGIHGEDVDDAAQFSDYTDYSGRPRTTAVVNWDAIGNWTKDVEYDSPEIKTIIQEIIDRAGWASGNAMVIFWDDHDDRSSHVSSCRRRGYSYDGSTTKAPKLHIEYMPPAVVGRSHGYIMG